MGTTTQQIEAHIEQTREALGSNLNELERKVNAATDWRHHFRTNPKIFLGIAFGGGVLLSAVIGGRSHRSEQRVPSKSRTGAAPGTMHAREEVVAQRTWENLKGAIVAVATTRLLNYAGEVFLGFHKNSAQTEKESGVISPEGE